MANYKTVKRKARVGERILITDASFTFGDYKNGDVLTVSKIHGRDGSVFVEHDLDDMAHIDLEEYEVIVGDAFNSGDRVKVASNTGFILFANQMTGTVVGESNTSHRGDYDVKLDNYGGGALSFKAEELALIEDDLPARVTELESKVAALETVLAEKTKLSTANVTFNAQQGYSAEEAVKAIRKAFETLKPKTPNQRRADVIKQARKLLTNYDMRGNMSGREGFKALNGILCDAEFIVNAEKRTVVCLMRAQYSKEILSKGIAKCAPDDVFNVDIGKAIALLRAKGVKVPAEFLDAPKPTEVVVGMVVVKHSNAYVGVRQTVRKIDGVSYWSGVAETEFWTKEKYGSLVPSQINIVDDTDAQYEALS